MAGLIPGKNLTLPGGVGPISCMCFYLLPYHLAHKTPGASLSVHQIYGVLQKILMKYLSHYFIMLPYVFTLLFLSPCVASMHPHSCYSHERSSLLKFKQSIGVSKIPSGSPSAYPKLDSWKFDAGSMGDCCSWDGVRCNHNNGHVIGLDLSSSFLYGHIDSSTTLFQLVHLRSLDLSGNHFNGSKIPPAIGNLSRLSYLNLSLSVFSGPVPSEVWELSKLVLLDLSYNSLELQRPSLRNLVERLINLKHLRLSGTNMSSNIPQTLGNLSSLEYLSLEDCGLRGEFPVGVFQLPRLQFLSVSDNPQLSGDLPEFQNSSVLQDFRLRNTSFFGKLPGSIGALRFLSYIDVSVCLFSGMLPSSIGELAKLDYLDLSYNNFSGPIPSSLANLSHLTFLSLSGTNFARGDFSWLGKQSELKVLSLHSTNSYGFLPSSLRNLTQLADLDLYGNEITGQIPSWIANLTQLSFLNLGRNRLEGSIPLSIFSLVNLEILCLDNNNLGGTLKFESFQNLKNLNSLKLSNIHLLMPSHTHINITRRKFQDLTLTSCNLFEFPNFLRYQDELVNLDLSSNQIHGQVPKWLWNLSTETLASLVLSANFLTGFEELPVVLPWSNLRQLFLDNNKLRGALPLPPPSTLIYRVSMNLLIGDISMICSLTSIFFLDLSSNNFSGVLPQCLGNLSRSLVILDLRNNSFHGTIPRTCMKGSKLKLIDFSHNQFRGKIPRSFASCKMLQILILENNQINDTFPSWLGLLPELKVLILRQNQLHDAIGKPETHFSFPKLRIIDLSLNRFTGTLPSQHFRTWNAMEVADADQLKYLEIDLNFSVGGFLLTRHVFLGMILTSKGIEIDYKRIQQLLVVVDLSNNRFEGSIPDDIANLKAIQMLNISKNFLSGPIPSSLASLSNLESLDLSQNKLTGEIPPALTQLTFLGYFNVSSNHLEGPIPQGKQFSTFPNSSFQGNQGLCGIPLSKKCGDYEASKQDQDEDSSSLDFNWKIVMIGYGSGILVGIVIGLIFTTKKEKWLLNFNRVMRYKREERRRRNAN